MPLENIYALVAFSWLTRAWLVAWVVILVMLIIAVAARSRLRSWLMSDAQAQQAREGDQTQLLAEVGVLWLILSILFWSVIAQFNVRVLGTVLSASAAGAAIGGVVGFGLSSYWGDQKSVGRLGDWFVGGVATLSIAEVGSGFKSLEGFCRFFVAPGGPDWPQVIACLLIYFFAGLISIYYLRKTEWNPQFARQDAKSLEFEKGLQENKAAIESAARPAAIERTADASPQRMEKIVDLADQADFVSFDPATAPASAVLERARLYRAAGRHAQAIPLYQALMQRKELLASATLELADSLGADESTGTGGRHAEAAAVLEANASSVGTLADWLLGYHLLWTDRLEDSIRASERYLQQHPDAPGPNLNAACGYAQRFEKTKAKSDKDAALRYLAVAVKLSKNYARRAQTLSDFKILRDDPEFQAIVSNKE